MFLFRSSRIANRTNSFFPLLMLDFSECESGLRFRYRGGITTPKAPEGQEEIEELHDPMRDFK